MSTEAEREVMAKDEAMGYIKAWGEDRTAANVAFYCNAIEYLIRKFAPGMLRIGNAMAAVQTLARQDGETLARDEDTVGLPVR